MACYYSITYYNADIWLIPTLSPALKQKLFSPYPKEAIYNDNEQGADWLALNYNQNFNSRI